MSSIERAKSFMQRKARLIALTAVPLATLVAIAPVKAGTIGLALQLDPASADTCEVTGGGIGSLNGGSACTVGQAAPGIKMFGNGTASLSSGGGILGVNFTLVGGTTNSGFISGQVPISWDFMMADSAGHNLNWSISLGATVTGVGAETVFTDTFLNVAPGTIIGNAMSNTLPSVQVTAYSMFFTVNDPSGVGGETVTVTIPNGSTVDVDEATAGVPEPGTFALLGFALAALGSLAWWRRRSTT